MNGQEKPKIKADTESVFPEDGVSLEEMNDAWFDQVLRDSLKRAPCISLEDLVAQINPENHHELMEMEKKQGKEYGSFETPSQFD